MVLRVISGQFRRRHLKTPQGLSTRPYTDRVRQMVFDRLEGYLENARVADVFSGVGTMGIESLSRGASSCVFFEADSDVYDILKLNVDAIASSVRTICWRTDVRRTSFRPHGGDDCRPYTLIFFDPPYAHMPLLASGKPLALSLKRLARPDVSSEDCMMILRTPAQTDFEPTGGWIVQDRWEMSTMIIWQLVKTPEQIAELPSQDLEG